MLQSLLDKEYMMGAYPDRSIVEGGVKLCDDILLQKKDNIALLKKVTACEDDLLDLSDDMDSVLAFFNNQRSVFDSASEMLKNLSGEKDYLQAEPEAMKALSQIDSIIKMAKPYRSISELPGLMHQVQTIYDQLLDLKRQDVTAEIQAAMGEIHQAARMDQKSTIESADNALVAKRDAAAKATTLTALDAMRIQISSLRQQYLKALMVPVTPNVDTVTASRSSISYTAKLENQEDIDKYVDDIRGKLTELLDGHDVLHII
jgi:hypothetical protein